MKSFFQNKVKTKGFDFPHRYYQPEKDETRKRVHFSHLRTRSKHKSFTYYIFLLGGVLWLMWYLSNRISN